MWHKTKWRPKQTDLRPLMFQHHHVSADRTKRRGGSGTERGEKERRQELTERRQVEDRGRGRIHRWQGEVAQRDRNERRKREGRRYGNK